MIRIWTVIAVGLLILLPPVEGMALPEYLYGFDMDQVSTPRFTQTGFQSVTTCTLAPGETPTPACAGIVEYPPSGQVGAGYLAADRPADDFRISPVVTDAPDLWEDGHRVSLAYPDATLRIVGLDPGPYTVMLLSHNPAGTVLDETIFNVEGSIGTIENITPLATDPFLVQTLSIPVIVDQSGIIDIQFSRSVEALSGVLNGVLIVPEPRAWLLLGVGIAALMAVRRLSLGAT